MATEDPGLLDKNGRSGVWWALRIGRFPRCRPYLVTDDHGQPMLFRTRENARYHASEYQTAIPFVLCERRPRRS